MKVHVPTSVDEVLGLLGEGVLVAGCTGIYPASRPDRVDHQPAQGGPGRRVRRR